MNLQADKQLMYADIILNIGQYWGNQEPPGFLWITSRLFLRPGGKLAFPRAEKST